MHAPPRPDPWHPDLSAEPAPDYSSYRSQHAGEVDVAFLSTYDSDAYLQHYGCVPAPPLIWPLQSAL